MVLLHKQLKVKSWYCRGWHPARFKTEEVWCRHTSGPLLQRCALGWFYDVARHWWAHDQGAQRPGTFHCEDQGDCSAWKEIQRLDRWFHPFIPHHLPTDVDFQGRIRWGRPHHRPSQVHVIFGISNRWSWCNFADVALWGFHVAEGQLKLSGSWSLSWWFQHCTVERKDPEMGSSRGK